MKYSELAALYEKLESTSKRLEKTRLVTDFLRQAKADDMEELVLLLQGRVHPLHDEREVGVASKLMVKALAKATGSNEAAITKEWKKRGDLGDVAFFLIGKKQQATLGSVDLSVRKVFANLQKLADIAGQGSVERKMGLIAELLTSAEPREARYITRTVLQDLRIGLGEGGMRDAIIWANFAEVKDKMSADERKEYNEISAVVQGAYNLTNDFGEVARVAKEHGLAGLKRIKIKIGVPIKAMLALKADTIDEAFKTVGKPAACEYKFDGFRVQIHKGRDIRIFTRRLEDITAQFPDIVAAVKKHVNGNAFILDAEAVGFSPKTKKYLPFQNVSQRIRRKYGIAELAKTLPVEVNVFDILSYDGKNLIGEPFHERRVLVEKIVQSKERVILPARQIITDDEATVKKFFAQSKAQGNEGIMIKKTDAPYQPGGRVGYMLKYKETMENLDLVIIGAEWGEGKRSAWLSSFDVACREGDEFAAIGRVATGLKEKKEEGLSFGEVTALLRPLIIKEAGKHVLVKPEIVIEVGYEEIQKSPTYASGYALRFPRVIRLRDDKGPEDAADIELIEHFYKGQRFK